ncbi:hypothetical protein [Streptomyces mobaraensis]|uniref:hypothetical protein n=2 Tax=Streptomyces mobaraensis TaxID=35621 RepID=UPI0033C290B5
MRPDASVPFAGVACPGMLVPEAVRRLSAVVRSPWCATARRAVPSASASPAEEPLPETPLSALNPRACVLRSEESVAAGTRGPRPSNTAEDAPVFADCPSDGRAGRAPCAPRVPADAGAVWREEGLFDPSGAPWKWKSCVGAAAEGPS